MCLSLPNQLADNNMVWVEVVFMRPWHQTRWIRGPYYSCCCLTSFDLLLLSKRRKRSEVCLCSLWCDVSFLTKRVVNALSRNVIMLQYQNNIDILWLFLIAFSFLHTIHLFRLGWINPHSAFVCNGSIMQLGFYTPCTNIYPWQLLIQSVISLISYQAVIKKERDILI